MKRQMQQNSKKILFILPDLNMGGAERVILNIINQLENAGIQIVLLVLNYNGILKNELPKNITIIKKKSRTLLSLFSLVQALINHKPNIVFSTHNRTNVLSLFTKQFFKDKTYIIREPNLPLKQKKILPYPIFLFSKIFYRFSDVAIAQTEEMKRQINKIYKVKNDKIKIIRNPLNIVKIESLANEGNPFEELQNYNQNDYNIISVGSLSKRKRIDILLESFIRIRKEGLRNLKLHIIGDGSERSSLEEFVNKKHLQEYVNFWGLQENPYMFMKYADILTLTSEAEGFPNVVIESLFLKTKVVVTNSEPEICKIIKDNELGEIAEVNDIEDISAKIQKAIASNYKYYSDYRTKDYLNFFEQLNS
jgi:glycosyltransferase involved in cell wall biosynthesis